MATISLRLLLLLLATAILLAASRAAPAPKCPSRCLSCVDGVAECSMRSLVTPPKDFPPKTRKIIMDGNHLRVLGTRSFQQLKNLEVLRMKGNKVRVVKKAAFKKLSQLMTLDLSNNQLVKIYSTGFDGLGQLRTLSLQYNQLRNMARIFNATPRLYQLNLAFNQLRTVGKNDLRAPTHIHYLDLRNNRIRQIHPEAFSHLTLLRYLFLNKNPLVTVPDMTFGSKVLQLVDFSRCRLTHVPRTMPSSVSDFRLSDNKIMQINDTDFTNMTHLRLLALNNNELHFVANGAFSSLESLDEIWLRNNMLVYIPRGLPDNLRKLYMDSNKIREIEDGLFTNMSRLDYLTVENNKINRIGNRTFEGLRFLKSLNFRGNKLQVIESGTFNSLGNLSTLSLSDNPLEKIEQGAFVHLDNLTFLHVDMCGEKMSLEQEDFLTQMPHLQQLSMMNSPGLGKAFVKMMANTPPIRPLKQLEEIDLTYNDLHTLSPNHREAFPALKALALDGNPWLCDRRLAWLRDWMVDSDISYFKYEQVLCEQPQSLKGRQIRDLQEEKFVEVAPTTEPPKAAELPERGADVQEAGDVVTNEVAPSPTDVLPSPQAIHDDSLQIGPKPSPVTKAAAPKAKKARAKKGRKQRRKNGKKKQRKNKNKGRKRRGRKGKGRKKRNNRSNKAKRQTSG